MPRLTVELLDSLPRLADLERDWRALFLRARGVTPFQSPDWILPWYDVFAPDRMQAIAVRDDGGRLRGLVPAVRFDGRLELAGSGVGDYLAPLVDEPACDEVAATIDRALASRRLPCRFSDVPPDAAWLALARGRAHWREAPASICPSVPLPADAAAWLETLPPGLRRNVRRYGTRLRDDEAARYETVNDARELPAALDVLMTLHAQRWSEKAASGVLADGDVRRFHELSAPRLLASGLLRLHLITAGDRILAAQYVLVHAGRAYSYIGGFDPAWKRYSPGTLLMAYAIGRAIDEGCGEFDLLRGREAYKYEWGAVDRVSVELTRDAA